MSKLPSNRQTTWMITGGAGFIGSNLVHHLMAASQINLVVIDALTYAGRIQSLEDLLPDPRLSFHQGNINDAGLLDRLFEQHQPSVVIHLAAETHVDRSIDGPQAFIDSNILGSFTLLECCLRHLRRHPAQAGRFRLLHVSTDEVYGSLAVDEPAVLPDAPLRPRSPYSASKACSDHLVQAWQHSYGLPVILTRCGNNHGPRQFPEKLIPLTILKCLRGEPVPIYGDGSQVRDWLHVHDHCRALQLIAQQARPGEIYHISANEPWSNLELVSRLCDWVDESRGTPGQSRRLITHVKDRPAHDQRYAIDSRALRQQLGWQPQLQGELGFKQTIDWYLRHEEWWLPLLEEGLRRRGLNPPLLP